jgi:hypothetical protein
LKKKKTKKVNGSVVVVIPHREDHKAVETGYYKATDIGKQRISYFFSQTNI